MAVDVESVEAQALKLGLAERARLAESLILSLDAPPDEENLRLWVAEAERRLRDIRAGGASEAPADQVFQRARAAIACTPCASTRRRRLS